MAWRSYPNPSTDLHVKGTFCAFLFFVQELLQMPNKTKVRRCHEWILITLPEFLSFLGEHRFSWAVMPHEGHFLDSDVPIAGYLYNSPLRGSGFYLLTASVEVLITL